MMPMIKKALIFALSMIGVVVVALAFVVFAVVFCFYALIDGVSVEKEAKPKQPLSPPVKDDTRMSIH